MGLRNCYLDILTDIRMTSHRQLLRGWVKAGSWKTVLEIGMILFLGAKRVQSTIFTIR